MSQIKFSHTYPKLLDCSGNVIRRARLLAVWEVELADLSAEFLAYDTAGGMYALPKSGRYMALIFAKPDGINIFTTLRRWTPEKWAYYNAQIGERMDVVMAHAQTADAP